MPRRTRPTLTQVRDLFRLIGDVRSIPDHPLVQRQALVDGVCRLLGADQGFLSEFEDWAPGRSPREISTIPCTRFDRRCAAFIQDFYATQAVEQDAMGAALYEASAAPGASAIAWHDAKRRKPSSRYGNFYELVRTLRAADILDPMSRHPSGHMVALSLHRLGTGARPFNEREKALATLLAEELAWLHRTRRLNVRDLVGRPLPPRLRELLGHLLSDRGVKVIAAAMGLTVNTARQYCDQLYKRVGVDSREQLMLRFLGQGGPTDIPR
jgi:DNA-binding CsgD family transcriptional regulator